MANPSSQDMHPLAGKRIVVSGAGIAGLAFARALDRFWPLEYPKPSLIIYERSPRVSDRRKEGYTMSIKVESGLHALEELGLLDAALNNSTVGRRGTQPVPVFWTKDWKPMLNFNL